MNLIAKMLSVTVVLYTLLMQGTDLTAKETVPHSVDSLAPVTVIDTVETDDKYVKILLLSDHTWEYFDLGRPQIDTAGMFDDWDNSDVHAFRETKLTDIPDEIDLVLSDSLHPYFSPVVGKVLSSFKYRKRRPHKGCDIPLSVGDTIRAPFDGVVRFSSNVGTGGYGHLLVIRHDNGLETYYGHLSKRLVDSNEVVKAGEIIGYGGRTGRATGPHLHFETRYQGHPFDPERIIDFETGELRDSIFTLHKHYFSIYSHYGQSDKESKAAAGRVVHTVRKGDTLGSLAAKYGTSVSSICRLNGISSKKILSIGQRLIVR